MITTILAGRVQRGRTDNPPDWLTRAFGGPASATGENVTESRALGCSAFYCGVTLISEAMGVLPLFVYRRTGDARAPAREHAAFQLLHRSPNPEQSASVFKRYMQANKLCWGNGYAEIERDRRGAPIGLWPIHPTRVWCHRKKDGAITYDILGGVPVSIAPEDMLHIRGYTLDGITGLGVLAAAREALGLGIASEQYAARFFANQAVPSVALKHPGTLGEEACKNLRTSWREVYGGENAHGVAVLEEGMDLERLTISAEDSQLLQTRGFQTVEIARFLNIPPHKLKNLDKATFSNIEQQAIEYVGDCLLPHCTEIEEECDRKLFAGAERADYFCEFNLSGMLRGDSAARSTIYKTLWECGVLSINDIRRLENMDGIGPAGDQHFVQLNLTTVERLAAGPPSQGNAAGGTPKEQPAESDLAFKRDVVREFLRDRTVNDVIYNMTDITSLLRDVGLPPERDVQAPFLPVVADAGKLVSGETIEDSEGDVVGGDVIGGPASEGPPTDEPPTAPDEPRRDAEGGDPAKNGSAAEPSQNGADNQDDGGDGDADQQAPEKPPRDPAEHADTMTAEAGRVKADLMPVFAAAAERAARKSANACARATERYKHDAAAFDAWRARFYGELADEIEQIAEPAVRSLARLLGRPVPDAALKRLAGLVAGEWREAAGKRPAEDVVVIAAPQLAQALSELV